MTTTFAPQQARAVRRARYRDSSDDIDTLVYERRALSPHKDASSGELARAILSSRRTPSMILTTPRPQDRELFETIMSQLSRPVRMLEQSAPLVIAPVTMEEPPNPFELPRQAGDPPPPWAEALERADRPTVTASLSYQVAYRPRRTRRSLLPLMALAMCVALSTGLAVDPYARHDVMARLENARLRVTLLFAR